MARYIDAEKLSKQIEDTYLDGDSALRFHADSNGDTLIGKMQVLDIIFDQPDADVEEVRHGEWIPLIQRKHWADTETVSTNVVGFYCSLCGAEEKFKYRYCHCGAKMDGKDKENDRN